MGSILHELVNVLLHVFEDEVKIVVDTDDFFELNDVNVIELSERFNFAKSHAFLPTVELLLHFLDGDLLVALLVNCLDHRAVRSIAKCLQNLIPVHLSLFNTNAVSVSSMSRSLPLCYSLLFNETYLLFIIQKCIQTWTTTQL